VPYEKVFPEGAENMKASEGFYYLLEAFVSFSEMRIPTHSGQ
jgi:hypothetical protein